MKTRYNTFDIICSITELQKLIGMRVNNIYDVDSKTYLIKLQRTEEKAVLLLESGNRFHTTSYEWPKNIAPSGFSMKLRKHLKNKRLESLSQLGTDRIIDMQFGSGVAAYHVILELYDRGNIILTDYELTILNVLRPHTEGDKQRFAVREKYPHDRARESTLPTLEDIKNMFDKSKPGDILKKILVPNLEYGPSLLDHVLLECNLNGTMKVGKDFELDRDLNKIFEALQLAERIFVEAKQQSTKGYIIQKREERPSTNEIDEKDKYFYSNQEFHPMLYKQHESQIYKEFPSFNEASDEFFSSLQGQKIDLKALQQEKEAIKKLDNVKKDHNQRLQALEKTQELDKVKAELITKNQQLVDNAILAVQSALATQVSWSDIEDLVKDASAKGDPVAKVIKHLKLNKNHISILLTDPYPEENAKIVPQMVDIDLGLSAFANARRYYDQKRSAAKKQKKTIESQTKAMKSAEKKTKQVLKEMKTTTSINKARKVYWFEKFFWFISSENYLVIGGRDQQQNELIVKRYMKPKDIYVHADIHGASSIVIKNPTLNPVPPKTLNEAGTMAICYSIAWDAKVLTNSYWVYGEQVSKTAPTGEYLTTGSFMVRGKKNFLPPSHLVLGLGFLFRLEDGSIERHKGERKIITNVTEGENETDNEKEGNDEEIVVSDGSEEEDNVESHEQQEASEDTNKTDEQKLTEIKEEGNEEEEKDSSDEEEEETSAFPDTQIKIKHFEGTKVNILTESSTLNKTEEDSHKKFERSNSRNINRRSESESEKSYKTEQNNEKEESKQQPAKRGQKSKLRKIKEKYKDQDDEERQLRMEILQSAGNTSTKKNKKNSKESQKDNKASRAPKPKVERNIEIDDDIVVQADVDVIDFLTGLPVVEDELLFAVPVVAPYNTLSNYKFKVKLTPGTSKRGKAAKTAVNMFLHERSTSSREKDLLKAVKDETLARNIPGKVKLSAPRLLAQKK